MLGDKRLHSDATMSPGLTPMQAPTDWGNLSLSGMEQMPGAGDSASSGAICSHMGSWAHGLSPGQLTLLRNCLPSTLKRWGLLEPQTLGSLQLVPMEGRRRSWFPAWPVQEEDTEGSSKSDSAGQETEK